MRYPIFSIRSAASLFKGEALVDTGNEADEEEEGEREEGGREEDEEEEREEGGREEGEEGEE